MRKVLLWCLLAVIPQTANCQVRILSVTSSANFVQGRLEPGSLASIFCSGLIDLPGVVAAPQYPLPRTLNGVTVTVNGSSAPILAVAGSEGDSVQQINIQVPWGIPTLPVPTVSVRQGDRTATLAINSTGAWPVFFADSSGYAIAQHSGDYRPVSSSDPASPGEWILVYATNLGRVRNQPPDGYPLPAGMLAPVIPEPSPWLSYFGLAVGPGASYMSDRIESNYIGLAPGSIVYQVNLRVPERSRPGDLTIQLIRVENCGFFFTSNCGRGTVTRAVSLPATIPVAANPRPEP